MRLPALTSRPSARSSAQRGSAVLIIVVLLAAMVLIVAANSDTLHLLKLELEHIDERQQKKYTTSARP